MSLITCSLGCIECGWGISFASYILRLVGTENQHTVGNSTISGHGTYRFYRSSQSRHVNSTKITVEVTYQDVRTERSFLSCLAS